MKTFVKILAIACGLLLLTSCGSSRKAVKENVDAAVPIDSVAVRDTFVHTHPPVVIPHGWREAQ